MSGPLSRLGRGVRGAVAASDPGLTRLRLAGTTVATVAADLVVLYGLVSLIGAPVTTAVPGVVLAMTASMAVRETEPGAQALSIALLAPAGAAGVALATVTGPYPWLADAVFVAVAVAAVLVRRLGPRGVSAGMVAFMCYFLGLFVRLTPDHLAAASAALAVGAAVTVGMRLLLRPRRPARDLRRMLAALGQRCGGVVDTLVDAVEDGALSGGRARRLRSQLGRAADAATAVEQRLDDADEPVLDTVGNDELAVRVFDLELAVENLCTAVTSLLREAPREAVEGEAAALAVLRGRLRSPVGPPAAGAVPDPPDGQRPDAGPDAVARLRRAVSTVAESWGGVVDPRRGAPDPGDGRDGDDRDGDHLGEADDPEDTEDSDDGTEDAAGLSDSTRQAVQVGVASALAILVGTQLSSTRWFWAVISAFVVYTGTSTRGEILSKGWQRVLGTMAGVVVGVVVAALVGGHVVESLVLVVVSLFLAVYLMPVSPALMIFFITTMLALVYGLLGRFTVDLLLLRLEETAAGAAIGVLVSFVVLPSSTRKAGREAVQDFLDELGEVLAGAVEDLTGPDTTASPGAPRSHALRGSFTALRSAVRPLTNGLVGVPDRSGSRRTMQALSVGDHHGRMLARLADASPGLAADPASHRALGAAARAVRANVSSFAGLVRDAGSRARLEPADRLLDRVDEVAAARGGVDGRRLLAAAAHLRAVDRAVCARAVELGAVSSSGPTTPDPMIAA